MRTTHSSQIRVCFVLQIIQDRFRKVKRRTKSDRNEIRGKDNTLRPSLPQQHRRPAAHSCVAACLAWVEF